MAIFSRRLVYRELQSLRRGIVDPFQAKDIIARLNGRGRQAISAEWEIIFASAFARCARVRYEECRGGRKPDLLVTATSKEQDFVEFLADIVAISDEQAERRNPALYFFSEFDRVAAKYGLTKGGFDIQIGDRDSGKWPDKSKDLLLPPKHEIPIFIKRELADFFRSAASQPTVPQRFRRVGSNLDLEISYDPAQLRWNTGSYASCSVPYSLRRNRLFTELNSKAAKLRQCGYLGKRGIIVADAGCRTLGCTQRAGGSPWSSDEIIEEFLRRHRYIDFVTTTRYERKSWNSQPHCLTSKIYWQRPFDQPSIDELHPLFNAAFKSLPTPITSPENAFADIHSRNGIERGCALGWYHWTPGRRLAYSSRTFVDLVAGTLPNQKFKLLRVDNLPNRGPLFDFFSRIFASRLQIREVRVESRPERDDDAIVFDLTETEGLGGPVSTYRCDIPTDLLVRYFAQLAYEAVSSTRERYSIGMLPVPIQQRVRDYTRQGRMITAASMAPKGDLVQLFFGERDAAISDYF